MTDNKVFSQGVWGALKVDWTLHCETPLVIRNGLKICYSAAEEKKIRNKDVQFHWRPKDAGNKKESEVACLHYGYEIAGNKVRRRHFVPASSVRGALRGWTIRHLVQAGSRPYLLPAKSDQPEEQAMEAEKLKLAYQSPETGLPLLASLFGLALDSDEDIDFHGNAGRLHLETEIFKGKAPSQIAINGSLFAGEAGPDNARRELVVRNPVDRITHASREGGLHHFLEFCQGEEFKVYLTILNPKPSDLGLISLWVREMTDGFLRIGALASIGRGRMSFKEQTYRLWQKQGKDGWPQFAACTQAGSGKDVLADLWQRSDLANPESALPAYEKYVVEAIGG
jgi:hypothetical protein